MVQIYSLLNIYSIGWLSLTFNSSYSYTRYLYIVEKAELTAPLLSFIKTMLVLVKSFKKSLSAIVDSMI